MRRSLLVTLISTLAFSFGSVKAGFGSAFGSRAQDSQPPNGVTSPAYDAMGVASNQIVCHKNAYSKREAYAAVHEAKMLEKSNKYAVAGCEKLVCTRYPVNFADRTLAFKLPGPYRAFPILANKKIYKGGRLPVRDLVIYNSKGDVAGIVHANLRGYFKCLLDDNYSTRPKGFFQGLKYRFRYWKGGKQAHTSSEVEKKNPKS